jgi:hypothetical protein
MMMYYGIKDDNSYVSPAFTLILTAVSILLWTIVLIGYYQKWLLRNFATKKNINRIKDTGLPGDAKILSVTRASDDAYELSLSFKNLVDTPIVQKASVREPYETGKKVGVIIDRYIKMHLTLYWPARKR